jgi:hypothetical protein
MRCCVSWQIITKHLQDALYPADIAAFIFKVESEVGGSKFLGKTSKDLAVSHPRKQ